MLFFMLHHRIFGETLNLDHSLSHGSNEAKQIGQNVKLHIKLLPFGAIPLVVVSTRTLPGEIANAKCK